MTPSGDAAARLAARVARAARRAGAARTLLLDVDGTLAPIAPTPEAAVVPPATIEALRRLRRLGWVVALISGRPAAQVRSMVRLGGLHVFGSHGLEGCWPGGAAPRVAPGVGRRLVRLEREAAALADDFPGTRVERKPAGLAIHDRGVAPARLRRWRERLGEWLEHTDLEGLERIPGKRVVELRPRGVDKGAVVRTMPRRVRAPRPDDSLVAIGDDRTDEDMFRALGGRGLSVRVGRAGSRSSARARLASPASVRRFLEQLAAAELSGVG